MIECRASALWRRPFASGFLLLLALGGHSVFAQNVLVPYGNEAFEYNSNLFYLPSTLPTPVPDHGGPRLSDETVRSIIGVDDTYRWGQQTFYANAEGRRLDYLHFTYLDHYEDLLRGGLDWKIGRAWDGNLEYRHERRMVDFAGLISFDATQLIIETDNVANASANLAITPTWRLESSLKDHSLDSPRTGALDLALHEDTWHEGIRYLGVANLSAGVEVEYLWGKYEHDFVEQQSTYTQWTTQIAGNYKITGLTNIVGAAGYTRRSTGGSAAQLGGFTGSLGYQYFLSGRTEITASVARAVNSYLSTASSEVDSSASLGAVYHVTYKTMVTASYSWAENKFPTQPGGAILLPIEGGGFVTEPGNRTDHVQIANLELRYQMLHWLAIRLYGRYQTRHSNIEDFEYSSNAYGIELLARLPNKGPDVRR